MPEAQEERNPIITEKITDERVSIPGEGKRVNKILQNPLQAMATLAVMLLLLVGMIFATEWLSRSNNDRVTSLSRAEIPVQIQATSVFQQGINNYIGTADTTLMSDRVRKNFGTDNLIKVQGDSWFLGMIRFDLASLPVNAVVQSARLELYLAKKNDMKQFNMGLYRLLRPWDEMKTTWNLALTGVSWGVSGANSVGVDREGAPITAALVNATSQWYFFDVTSAVQGWAVNPSSNFGLIARGDNSNDTEYHFISANNPALNLRPRLTVVYTTISRVTPTPPILPSPIPTTVITPPLNVTSIPRPTPTPTPVGGIWKPPLKFSFHWMIAHALNVNNAKDMGLTYPDGTSPVKDYTGSFVVTSPDVYDIDGFFNGQDPNCNIKDSAGKCVQGENDAVRELHAMGKKVVCYIDVGVYENYRPDAYKFPASVIGKADTGWAGSNWLDIRRTDILGPIMQARMKMCKDKGFDSIEPDEITNYSNNSGFPLTYQDQINYNKFVANMAHSLGISIALKGDIEQAVDLVPYFDWVLNEECAQYKECDLHDLSAFTRAGKAVVEVEYKTATTAFCSVANTRNWNGYKMPLNLDGGRWPCR